MRYVKNSILCVDYVLCCFRINSVYALCVTFFMMHKLASIGVTIQPKGVTVQPIRNKVDELPKRVVLGGKSTKGIC